MKYLKKYLVLIVVALLFAGALWLNLRANGMPASTAPREAADVEQTPATAMDEDYFDAFREERQAVRELEMQYLDEVIAASASDAETLADAQAQKLALVENMEKEFTIESLVKAKGFEDAAVTFHAGAVNVVVKSENLSDGQVAQILDIACGETGESAENIKVMTGE